MRVGITLESENGGRIEVPIHYNYPLSSAIYKCLPEEYRSWLHDDGFCAGSRRYKLFTFSLLRGKMLGIRNGSMAFKQPVKLFVSSPNTGFIEHLVNGLLRRRKIRVGSEVLKLSSIKVLEEPDFSTGSLTVRAISPITVYSTLYTRDFRRKTYYYSPYEEEFAKLIKSNILGKAKACGINGRRFRIEPVRVRKRDERIVIVKGIVVKGWMGIYRIDGDPDLLRLAYEAGLGAKNSVGFGMVEVVRSDT